MMRQSKRTVSSSWWRLLSLLLIVHRVVGWAPRWISSTRQAPAPPPPIETRPSLASWGIALALLVAPAFPSFAEDLGASSAANAKLTTGGASTLQSGRTISITRGVNLDGSNFAGQNLKGVAFQQSVVRDADFSKTNLVGASFFDATVDGSNFNDADMSLANVEMAQFNRATLRNTILHEVYVSGATLFTGIEDIEGSDWTDTFLRADQQKYLCSHPTAKGVNPVTGISTRESLQCKD